MQRAVIMEKYELRLWRFEFLRKIEEYRRAGRVLVYLDETWFNASESVSKGFTDGTAKCSVGNPIGKGERLIIIGAGGDFGWVPNSFFCFRTKKAGAFNYHEDMNAANFEKWLCEKLLPNLPPNSVIILDNASYHSRKSNSKPTKSRNKGDIVAWLDERGIPHGDPRKTLKVELLQLVAQHYTGDRFYVEDLAQEKGHDILRLPPYHCHFNPIENVWSILKARMRRDNTSFKADDCVALAYKSAESIGQEIWANECKHAKNEEQQSVAGDLSFEHTVEPLIISTEGDSDED